MSAAAIVLSAGKSTRLGSPKQLAVLRGEILLERAIRVAQEAECTPVIVVLGAYAEAIKAVCDLRGVSVMVNEHWFEGMGSSIRVGVDGLSAAEAVEGCVLMTCDMPAVTPEHLRDLIAYGRLSASFYGRKLGVPAYFPASMFPELAVQKGDAGARELLHWARRVDLHGGELDIDTVADLGRAEQFLELESRNRTTPTRGRTSVNAST